MGSYVKRKIATQDPLNHTFWVGGTATARGCRNSLSSFKYFIIRMSLVEIVIHLLGFASNSKSLVDPVC